MRQVIQKPTLTILPVLNGYIVHEQDQTRRGVPIAASSVFESMENALSHIATQMGEEVLIYPKSLQQ